MLDSQCRGAHPLLWQLSLPEDSSNYQKALPSTELKSGPTLLSRAQSPRPMPPTHPVVSGIPGLPIFTCTQEGQYSWFSQDCPSFSLCILLTAPLSLFREGHFHPGLLFRLYSLARIPHMMYITPVPQGDGWLRKGSASEAARPPARDQAHPLSTKDMPGPRSCLQIPA